MSDAMSNAMSNALGRQIAIWRISNRQAASMLFINRASCEVPDARR